MSKYYIQKSVVGNEDYFAEKVNTSEDDIYRESVSGISLKNKNIKIELKKNKAITNLCNPENKNPKSGFFKSFLGNC